MDFVPIDLETTAPIQYLCCERCLSAYTSDTVIAVLRCPKCGLGLWRGSDRDAVEKHIKLLEEVRK